MKQGLIEEYEVAEQLKSKTLADCFNWFVRQDKTYNRDEEVALDFLAVVYRLPNDAAHRDQLLQLGIKGNLYFHGPRALRVTHDLFPPGWFITRLNECLPDEVNTFFAQRLRTPNRHRLHGRYEASNFLLNSLQRLDQRLNYLCSLFDHYGVDAAGNVVTEPYARNCASCLTMAALLAEKLGLHHTISPVAWWYPPAPDIVHQGSDVSAPAESAVA